MSALLPIVVAGCVPPASSVQVPLLDAPILGGSPEQREAAVTARSTIQEDLGQLLEVEQIVFLETCDLPGENCSPGFPGDRGSYFLGTVQLDDDLAVDDIDVVLRHELCHAMHRTWALTLETVFPLDVVEILVSEAGSQADDDDDMFGEAFAQLCENGPAFAEHMSLACEADPGHVQDIGAWLDSEIWLGPSALAVAPHTADVWTWTPAEEGDEIHALRGPGAIHVLVEADGDTVDDAWLDVYSGEEIDPVQGDLDLGEDLDHGIRFEGLDTEDPVGWWTGPGAQRGFVDVGNVFVWRVYTWDGETWSLAGCDRSPGRQQVLAVDEQVIDVWLDELAVVSWTTVKTPGGL